MCVNLNLTSSAEGRHNRGSGTPRTWPQEGHRGVDGGGQAAFPDAPDIAHSTACVSQSWTSKDMCEQEVTTPEIRCGRREGGNLRDEPKMPVSSRHESSVARLWLNAP